ncbi:MAG: transposase [Actinomycetota bacterium]|nr:transposase [Actinomycetota bacterium]
MAAVDMSGSAWEAALAAEPRPWLLDQLGRRLGELSIATHTGGFARLIDWASEFGVMDKLGVEGTGSWGAGLARWLRAEGLVVVEVDRPKRKTRRHGKSDTIDAEAAARAVLSGEATAVPKTGDGRWR